MSFKNDLRIALIVSAAVLAAVPAGAQTLTSGPNSNTVVTPANDYAASQWQDPWDMKQRTDIGWFTWAVESESLSGMASKGMTSHTGSPTAGCGGGSTDCQTFLRVETSHAARLIFSTAARSAAHSAGELK